MKVTEFDIKINKKNVLELIDCHPGSPVYESVEEELEEMLSDAYEKLSPAAVLAFGDITEYDLSEYGEDIREALFCIESVGKEIGIWTTELFEKGNYLKGMLASAIADDCLFQMDGMLKEPVIQMCQEKGFGVVRRLEAPQDIPMEVQKTAWEITRAEDEIGLGITESYMFDPVKSNCQIYILKEGLDEYRTEHDCSNCPRIDCKMRNLQKFPVIIKQGEKEFVIEGTERQTLLEILQNAGIYLSAVCAGKGTCGKCKVQFLDGVPKPSKADEKFFDRKALEDGYRLACTAAPNQSCRILLADPEEEGFVVVADGVCCEGTQEHGKEESLERGMHCGIAADIGTTTIAMQLVDTGSGAVIDTYTAINRQRTYGADVISRIQASNEGKQKELKTSILEDLERGIKELFSKNHVETERMVISGNTTMIHLLMGYSCETLGVYPFTPVNIDTIETDFKTLFESSEYDFPITIIPGISTYVGGDIAAGLLVCGFDKNDKVSVLIDLGTNGEMAIGSKERILVTSTAAGPAFEGGNIICGTGSIPGAVCKAEYREGKFNVYTIGGEKPAGICGTGVIDITYELMKHELIDETGLMDEDYFEDGILAAENGEKEIRFYQKDVREMQLAKSAIRAGFETLLVNYGVSYDEIDAIYIAGGFGYKIDIEKAVGIGLFPKECKDKMKAVGNSSLSGSRLYLTDSEAGSRIAEITGKAREIQLAASSEFNDFYMQHMYFLKG